MSDPTRRVPKSIGADGVPVGTTITSPTENKVRAELSVVPHSVVPIILLPGIMGSNLFNTRYGEAAWTVNSKIGLAMQWIFRSSAKRQRWLNPDDIEVDLDGKFPGKSASVPNSKVGRERGWGGVAKAAYGDFLVWLDNALNKDLLDADGEDPSPWQSYIDNTDVGKQWGAEKPGEAGGFDPITQGESDHALNFYCPVHAVGYNWLQSNIDSGVELAAELKKIIEAWNSFERGGEKPFKCEKVILVTHSMGGLVARAAVSPAHGGAADLVLGVVHGVMPANGAAATYHHCRTGYDGIARFVLGRNAAQVTAIIGNAAGPLELLPNQAYRTDWLRARTQANPTPLMGLPAGIEAAAATGDPYIDIYLEKERWWRLIDPGLIDPDERYAGAKPPADPWVDGYASQLKKARTYHKELVDKYHPLSYVHFGDDPQQPSYNNLWWRSKTPVGMSGSSLVNARIQVGSDSDPVTLDVPGGIEFEIMPDKEAGEPGDNTVPVISGEAPLKTGGAVQGFRMKNVSHGDSYDDKHTHTRESVVWSIGKLLSQAKEL
ncbi:alpha/beta hydrolase [Lysobacter yananisis]|uniref:Alpha/beta hydrolase n=1 Tax=Lysobacter yananisis TaxID=1003114 RepID=A0ABY9PAR6_9GAMM|nr:alpha/beta hydrolase [Lysobacter yananisis]WMT04054.1 alpha/beta hydrolase [Lysobacter yananisis]